MNISVYEYFNFNSQTLVIRRRPNINLLDPMFIKLQSHAMNYISDAPDSVEIICTKFIFILNFI